MGSDNGAPSRSEKANWWQRMIRSGTGQAVRWVLVLALLLGHWLVTSLGPISGHAHWLTTASLIFGQKGSPGSIAGWVPVIIFSLLLLLPDADSVAFGGVKLELRRTMDEVTGLRNQVTNLQLAQARASAIGALSLRTENPEVARVFAASVGLTTKTAVSEGTVIEDYDPGA